jgi:N6-adenosine-specific RNA methylase IME4
VIQSADLFGVSLQPVRRPSAALALVPEFQVLRPMGGFDFIMADPPWSYEMYSEAGYEKSPDAHYRTMDIAAIKAMPVELLAAKDCLLWLWAVGPMLPEALEVIAAWGFRFKTQGQWAKMTKNGKQSFGTGYLLRNAGEPFLIATRGAPKVSRVVRNTILGLVREHSRKPEEAYREAKRLMPEAQRLDLFSRQPRPGWVNWGDESEKFAGGA